MMNFPICPTCHFAVAESYYFCPNCGKKLKEVPPETTITKQITLYLISFFLPPFGLMPGIKYLRQSDEKSRKIGMISLVLTALSIIITVWYTVKLTQGITSQLNGQMNQYQGLGL